MAIVAVAGVNVYLASDVIEQKNKLSLLNLENIAEAQEIDNENSGQQRNGRSLSTKEDETGKTIYCCQQTDNPYNNCDSAKNCEDI